MKAAPCLQDRERSLLVSALLLVIWHGAFDTSISYEIEQIAPSRWSGAKTVFTMSLSEFR
jgi:hypothetical protein